MRALVERHPDAELAIVGVNTDSDKDQYRRQLGEYGVTWRNAWQGSTEGPIPTAWGVRAYPALFILDAHHVIRALDARGGELERIVDALVAERNSAGK